MNFALVNPQHKNVCNPDRQMMSRQGSKMTILHVERNGIPVGMHRQCHNTSCVHTSVQLKMLGNTHKQLNDHWYVFSIIKVLYFKNKIQL